MLLVRAACYLMKHIRQINTTATVFSLSISGVEHIRLQKCFAAALRDIRIRAKAVQVLNTAVSGHLDLNSAESC